MAKRALVVGGNLAGVLAALNLADAGIRVTLVEKGPFLTGGNGRGDLRLAALLLEATKHPLIEVLTQTRVSRLTGQRGEFQVEVHQWPRWVDPARCTSCGDCEQVCPVTVPGTTHKAIYRLNGAAAPTVYAIEKLGQPPCSNACPGGIHVQGYVALIAQGRFQEALDLIREAIPFPGICGRVCTRPCEEQCRRTEVDGAVAIRALKRFVADLEHEGHETRNTKNEIRAAFQPSSFPVSQVSNSPRVAVIGAGPAGLTVADNLIRRGYRVTVFEALPVPGGMMVTGIPSYRLPREVIFKEVAHIVQRGAELRLNTCIGPDGEMTIDDLFAQGFQAVFIGVGAHRPRRLNIPGEELEGVVPGIHLLRMISFAQMEPEWSDVFPGLREKEWQKELDALLRRGEAQPIQRVAVIGGGNTAMDVARSLLRLGLKDVRVLYRRTRAEMPAIPEEVDEAEKEGIPIEFLVSPIRVIGEDGRVTALECIRMKLGEPDASGRRRPVPIPGTEFIMDVDMVVTAIGQTPDLSFLGDEHPFAITRRGTFDVDAATGMTSRPGVFAAGDAITQPAAVIYAIGSAKRAAAGIDAYLQAKKTLGVSETPRVYKEMPIARRELTPEELTPKPRHHPPTIPMAERVSGFREVEGAFDAETAVREAQRCLVCGPECLACVKVCQPRAINHELSESYRRLDVGAVIVADARQGDEWVTDLRAELQVVAPADTIGASAAAARAMVDLFAYRERLPLMSAVRPAERLPRPDGRPRIGVFVCRCEETLGPHSLSPSLVRPPLSLRATGERESSPSPRLPLPLPTRGRDGVGVGKGEEARGRGEGLSSQPHNGKGGQIAGFVDMAAIVEAAAALPSVIHAQEVPFACHEETAGEIRAAVEEHGLDRVVVAACSCCSLDQVCYSCTTQRVRCRGNLGVFGDKRPATGSQGQVILEFVNIREQGAWVHADDPARATAVVQALIAGAVARVRLAEARSREVVSLDGGVLVVGDGPAGRVCAEMLAAQGFRVMGAAGVPQALQGGLGHLMVVVGENGRQRRIQAGAVVLAPTDAEQMTAWQEALGPAARLLGESRPGAGFAAMRPGVFVCPPPDVARSLGGSGETDAVGAAVAAQVAAALGAGVVVADVNVARVDPLRCRGCGTCEEVCEFGAVRVENSGLQDNNGLQGNNGLRVAQVNAAVCQGCGTCAAHCPTGAIVAGYSSDAQIEAMLRAVLR